jgi:pimeloyl-ACP methyl ester carboxylesterase
VIRFDKRGTGLSDPTDALPSMDERVVDLAAVMDAAESETAVVFGVSDGGRGAIAFAVAHPGRVLGQVRPGPDGAAAAPLTPELIAGIISADLTRRGVQAPGLKPSLSDQGWLDKVHATYYIPVSTLARCQDHPPDRRR